MRSRRHEVWQCQALTYPSELNLDLQTVLATSAMNFMSGLDPQTFSSPLHITNLLQAPNKKIIIIKKPLCGISSTMHMFLIMAGVEKICRKGAWGTLSTVPSWEDTISACFPGLTFQTRCFEWDLSHLALEIYIWASHPSCSMERTRHVWGVNHLIYFVHLL